MNDSSFPPSPPGDSALTLRHHPRSLVRRAWPSLGLLLLLGVGAWLYFHRAAESQAPTAAGKRGGFDPNRPVPVAAAPVKALDIDIIQDALGTVTPLATVTVRTRVDGQLMRVAFQEGQIVKAGDVLAEIDPRPYQVQLTQAQGQMARDRALLRNAQLDLERYRTLLAQDSIAKQLVDTQEALVRQYQGAVEADQGQVDNARLQLTYARITAPIGGRLGLRQVDSGNIVHASDANGIVVITQVQPISVLFTIPEDRLQAVLKRFHDGNMLPIEAYDRDGKTRLASGTLLTIDNQIDTTTGTVKLRGQFENKDSALFPNQFVNVRMKVDTRAGATAIPSAAIQRGTPGTFVYVVKEDRTVSVRPVKLGPADNDNVLVESGVAPGEKVVIDGADKLREGGKVDVVERGAAAAAGSPQRRSQEGGDKAQRQGARERKAGE